MTVAIPEAAGAVGAADAGAVSSRAGAGRARTRARQRRPTPAEMGRPGGSRGRPTVEARQVGERRPVAAQRGARPQREGNKGKSRKRDAGELAGRLTGASTRPGGELHNYQAIVAAEFVAAILLVALTPMAARKASPSATSGQLSPYVPGDLVQLVAIGIVYLILEGIAAGPRGAARFAAWFGFLILLTVGLYEGTRIAEVFKMLAGFNVGSIQLTGAQAPATKGESPIPPLAVGQPAPSTPPKPGG
jgi:hypothetical protein